jgi:hypothetical protein
MPNFSRPSTTVPVNVKLWKKVAYLHLHDLHDLHDLDDIEHHVSFFQNALPHFPNLPKDQVYFKGPYTPIVDTKRHFVSPYLDTSDHLLSLVDEPEGPGRPASHGLNPYEPYGDESTGNSTSSTSSIEPTLDTTTPSSVSNYSKHTMVKMVDLASLEVAKRTCWSFIWLAKL